MFTKNGKRSMLSVLFAPFLWLFATVGALTVVPRMGRWLRRLPWQRTA
ncbi:MAG: hypothetical protein IJF73_06755 [Clostridia bacterium]|nr:hypothetical protein [Clostridia bacterium]